ncbi:MAG: hypothetical protein M3O36_15685 [Myxococcota bacterium]|nr:hypothetical protein [Myxococcota bacterium]
MLERSVAAAALCALGPLGTASGLVACGASSSASAGFVPFGTPEGGSFDATTDAHPLDAGGDSGTSPEPILFVNASPSLGAIRLCWSVGSQPLSATAVPFPSGAPMPASNYAGVAVGGAEWLDAERTNELIDGDLTLYALDAKPLVTSHEEALPCGQLICNAGCNLKLNRAYWRVGTVIPAGSLSPGRANVIAITGCLGSGADLTATTARCGATWDSVRGNLHADVVSLASSAVDDGGLAVQAVQLSPGIAWLSADAGGTVVTFGREADPDAALVAQLADEATFGPPSAVRLALPTGLAAFGQFGFGLEVPRPGSGPPARAWTSLAQAQSLINPALDPTRYYGAAGTYIVAIVGDPSVAQAVAQATGPSDDAGYDGTGLHVLVLPPRSPAP